MTAAFADTSYFLALLNPADQLRSEAIQLKPREIRPPVTTEFVLMAVGDGHYTRGLSPTVEWTTPSLHRGIVPARGGYRPLD